MSNKPYQLPLPLLNLLGEHLHVLGQEQLHLQLLGGAGAQGLLELDPPGLGALGVGQGHLGRAEVSLVGGAAALKTVNSGNE